MRLASFNVEGLFHVPGPCRLRHGRKANRPSRNTRRSTICSTTPSTPRPTRPRSRSSSSISIWRKRDDAGEWVILRQNHSKLLKRPKGSGIEITATGRGDWIGWVELLVTGRRYPDP